MRYEQTPAEWSSMERSLARVLVVVVACCGCATAEDDLGIASYDAAGNDAAALDTQAADTARDSAVDDTPADSTTADSATPDSATTDSATEDSSTVDTAIADSGTVDTATTDTTPPVCGATDKYGPKCKTNADCTAIPTCGYVCCAFDPFLMTNLGCGRTSAGSLCAP